MATKIQKQVVESSLRSLEGALELLHLAIDDKIKKVLVDGQNWLSRGTSTETAQSYEELTQMTCSAISFLSETLQSISDNWEEVVKQKMSAGSETRKSNKSSKVSAKMADIKLLKTQMKDMEEKMSSFTHSVQELTSRQDLVESCVKDTSSKYDLNASRMETDITDLKKYIQDWEHREVAMKTNVGQVAETVQNLSSHLTALKTRVDLSVGFTAHFHYLGSDIDQDQIISGYENVTGNKDQSFCSDTGIFTAPVKGMYAVCLRQLQSDSGQIVMCVYKSKQNDDSAATVSVTPEEIICGTWTQSDGQSDFCLLVTELGEGDTLYAKLSTMTRMAYLDFRSKFSCFFIS